MNLLERIWYQPKHPLKFILLPFSYLFQILSTLRRYYYQLVSRVTKRDDIIVIVVGNITVGGTGKTPLVIHLVEWLRQHGYRPGVIMRGYGGSPKQQAILLNSESKLAEVGDEAYMIYQRCKCPIVVAKARKKALDYLVKNTDCNIVISDDGLQHYPLARDIEIAVVDGARRFGNGCCLPAGPLREKIKRLQTVDFIVTNGIAQAGEFSMTVEPHLFQSLQSKEPYTLNELRNKSIFAVAGIGNPSRFFSTLENLRLNFTSRAYPDHYPFHKHDFVSIKSNIILMTEKDAVKCQQFADERFCYLSVIAKLPEEFSHLLLAKINSLITLQYE